MERGRRVSSLRGPFFVLAGDGGNAGSQGGRARSGDALLTGWHPAKRQAVSGHSGRQSLSLGSHLSPGRCSLERRGPFLNKAQDFEAKKY